MLASWKIAGAAAALLGSLALAGWAGWQARDAQAQRDVLAAHAAREQEEQRRREALAEITREARDGGTRDAAARAAADRAREQLLQRLQAAVAAARAAPAGGSAAADGDPVGVLAGVLERADAAAGEIAAFADRAHRAGLACQRAYDSLTPR